MKKVLASIVILLLLAGCNNGPYYKTCEDAVTAGVAPLAASDPGYRESLDRDGDGMACDG